MAGNDYVKSRENNLSRNFLPFHYISPNDLYSLIQDDAQNTGKHLYTQTALGKLLVNSYCRWVIGKGLVPMASPETKFLKITDKQAFTFQEQAEAYWRMMSDVTIDFYGKNGYQDLQKIAFLDICNTGDCLHHYGYRKIKDGNTELVIPFLQLISGRMVTSQSKEDTKDNVGGVLFTRGRESGYQIRILDNNYNDTGAVRKVNRYNSLGRLAFNLVQLGQSDPSIVRGVPLLATLRDDILSTNMYKDNHTMQSVIQNLFTAFITHTDQGAVPLSEKLKEVAQRNKESKDDYNLAAGNVVDLEVGENVVFSPRGTSNDDYNEGMKANIGVIASALGMSYETAMNTYNASFSASRAGISGTEKASEIVRLEYIRKAWQPVWENVIEHGILTGHIEAPWYDGSFLCRRATFASTWTGVTPPTVDLTKEVNAYALAVEKGLCSKEFAIRMLFGMDFDEVSDRTAKEENNANTDTETDNDTDTDTDTEGENDNE